MNLFLDAHVALAACGRPSGASRAIFDLDARNGWTLMTSGYVLGEISVNLPRLGPVATQEWHDCGANYSPFATFGIGSACHFQPVQDRPMLFTAAAWAQVLLTLDRGDFGAVMSGQFYGLEY